MAAPAPTRVPEGDVKTAVTVPDDVRWPRSWRPRGWVILVAVGTLCAAAIVSAAAVDADSGGDLLALLRAVAVDIGDLRWQYMAVVAGLAAVHYLATAIAARAAAGIRLPLGEATLVQLAAAAANRLTPAGLGASAVNARYMNRRGLSAPAAVGAAAALSVLGAVADVLVVAGLILMGSWLNLRGASGEIAVLTTHLAHLGSGLRSPWLWTLVATVILAVWWRARRRRGHNTRRWREFCIPIAQLPRRPRRLSTLLVASGSTTVVLGVAFVASAAMVPGPQPHAGLGALLVAFMIGAAAGSSVPVPAGFGSTEAALIAVLMAAHVPASHAVQQVLIFRLITFWAPAIVGVFTTRYLYRRRAI